MGAIQDTAMGLACAKRWLSDTAQVQAAVGGGVRKAWARNKFARIARLLSSGNLLSSREDTIAAPAAPRAVRATAIMTTCRDPGTAIRSCFRRIAPREVARVTDEACQRTRQVSEDTTGVRERSAARLVARPHLCYDRWQRSRHWVIGGLRAADPEPGNCPLQMCTIG